MFILIKLLPHNPDFFSVEYLTELMSWIAFMQAGLMNWDFLR